MPSFADAKTTPPPAKQSAPLPSPDDEDESEASDETVSKDDLRRQKSSPLVRRIAREHNVDHYDELEKVARYLEATLESLGYAVGRQEFPAGGKTVRNIDATIEPRATVSDPEVIVVGAHYDSAQGTPGANDNARNAEKPIAATMVTENWR